MTTTAKMMRAVWLSMIPAAGAAAFRFGGGVLWQIALCAAAAVCAEAFCLRLRGALDGRRFFASADFFSALVAALIVALSLPPQAFWAAGAGAAFFAVAVAKHCFGGLGANPFNPAMAGVALAVVAFPGEWSEWPAARTGLWESARIVFSNPPPADAVSTATPLTARRLAGTTPAWQIDWPFALAVCGGGAFLLWRKIADYRLVAGFCAGAAAAALVASWLDENAIPVVAHFAWGGFLFAAFFVVTDPPSAATGRGARWLYAVGAGAAVVWLRENGADADAVAFADFGRQRARSRYRSRFRRARRLSGDARRLDFVRRGGGGDRRFARAAPSRARRDRAKPTRFRRRPNRSGGRRRGF